MERSEFNEIFNRLNDGKKVGNAACMRNVYGAQPETDSWNGRDANLYGAYAVARAVNGMSHDEALVKAKGEIK